jgi:hypothetical protein
MTVSYTIPASPTISFSLGSANTTTFQIPATQSINISI